MRFYPGDPDHQPLGHVGRVPVFAATIIAALLCVGMLVTTMLATANAPYQNLGFSPEMFFRHGWIWQVATYPFISPPSFFFIFGVFMVYLYGSELEIYLGRRSFLKLYCLLVAVPALVLGFWYLFGVSMTYFGRYEIIAGLFIGYATLYPNLEYFGWVPMKHIAFACLAVAILSYFPAHDWVGLSTLVTDCALSFGFVRYLKLGGSLELRDVTRNLNPFRRRPKFRVLPNPEASSRRPSFDASESSTQSVDAILDKIAQKGFASLTQDERDQLEKAREILNKKRQ